MLEHVWSAVWTVGGEYDAAVCARGYARVA